MRWLALLLLAGCVETAVSDYAGTGPWRLTEIDGSRSPGEATLSFPAPEFVTGTLPCNEFTAHQHTTYPAFRLSHFEIGTGVCSKMPAERVILETLTSMTRAEIRGRTMLLSDDASHEMTFRR